MGWDANMGPCMMKWCLLSPRAHVMVDPVSGARGIIRDTCADGDTDFIGASSPRRSLFQSPRDAPEGLHGRGRSPKKRSVPMPRTSACTPRYLALTLQPRCTPRKLAGGTSKAASHHINVGGPRSSAGRTRRGDPRVSVAERETQVDYTACWMTTGRRFIELRRDAGTLVPSL